MPPAIVVSVIAGVSLILAVGLYAFSRIRIEQERTLQKLIERGAPGDALLVVAGIRGRGARDLRRGLLLVGVGVAWSVVTYTIGGSAWVFGVVPISIGVVLVLFRMLNGRPD